MITVRRTYAARTHSARMLAASVMRRRRTRQPAPASAPDTRTPLEKRLDEMEREGTLVRQPGPRGFLRPVATIPGALERFLAERHYASTLTGDEEEKERSVW